MSDKIDNENKGGIERRGPNRVPWGGRPESIRRTTMLVSGIYILAIVLFVIYRIPNLRHIFTFGMVAMVFALLSLPAWVRKAYENLPGLKSQGMTQTPNTGVLWFYLPFTQPMHPYMVFEEIWRVIQDPTYVSTVESRSHLKPSRAISFWWLSWALIWVMIPLVYVYPTPAMISITSWAGILNATLTLWLMIRIDKGQKERQVRTNK